MNRETSPTDWKGAMMQKRIAGRYAAERRFKLMGLGAVLLSGAFLAFLLFVMVGNGARGFTYTHVAVPVDFKAMPLTIDKGRLSDVLARIPVNIVTNPHVGLIGAAMVAMRQCPDCNGRSAA